MDVATMNLTQLVQNALRNYEERTAGPLVANEPDLVIPNPLGYALGWVVADAIVQDRYRRAAIDAIPICHPEHGWDRILLTRRVSCLYSQSEPADWYGTLQLTGENTPIYVSPEREEIPLGSLLRRNPEEAVAKVLEACTLSDLTLPEANHSSCYHVRAEQYPDLYDVVTEIIAEYPGVIALREIYVDEELIEGGYHPIYLMTSALTKGLNYGWFALETDKYTCFFRVTGEQSVYLTDNDTWATVEKQLTEEDSAGKKRRILSWLRLEGQPDRDAID